VLYREERARARAAAATSSAPRIAPALTVRLADGTRAPLDEARLVGVVAEACAGLDGVAAEKILAETRRNLYDGISLDELALAPILAARTVVEEEPNYAFASARLLLDKLRSEALTFVAGRPDQATEAEMADRYGDYFLAFIEKGVAAERLDPELKRF